MALVSVKINFQASSLRFRVDESAYGPFLDGVKSAKSKWIRLETHDDGEVWLRGDEVIAVEMNPVVDRESGLAGVTVKDICAVTGRAYPTLVRKINKPGSEYQLDMLSDRRIATTEKNFDRLDLTQKEREALRKIEATRKD